MNAHAALRGRRGGLALRAAAAAEAAYAPYAASGSPALPAAPDRAPTRTPTRAAQLRALRERVRWTLVFFAFFTFAGGVIASRLTIGQPMMILGVVGLMLQSERVRVGPVPGLLAAWSVWAALGYFTSPHPGVVWEPLVQLGKLCVISLVGVNALRTRGQIRAYCAFVVFAFLLYPGRGTLLNWITGANVMRGGRAIWNGVYANPNDLAGITLLIIAAALAFLAGERRRLPKLGALGVVGFLAFVIFITQSRGALVALGVFVVVGLKRVPRPLRLRAALAVGALGAVLVVFAPASVWDRLAGLKHVGSADTAQIDAEGSADQRLEIWKVARTIIAEHPVTGVGVGAYPYEHSIVAARPDFKPTARGQRDTHSMYLNVLAETGVAGFCLFAAVLLVPLRYANRVRRRVAAAVPDGALQLQFLQLGLLAYCVAAIWGSYAKLNVLYLHLTVMWALAKACEREAALAAGEPRPGVA